MWEAPYKQSQLAGGLGGWEAGCTNKANSWRTGKSKGQQAVRGTERTNLAKQSQFAPPDRRWAGITLHDCHVWSTAFTRVGLVFPA